MIDFIEHLAEFDVVCPDMETTGLQWYRDEIFGVAIGAYDKELNKIYTAYYDVRDKPQILVALKKELPKCKRVINHNLKFDAHFMKNHRIEIDPNAMECTVVRQALINEWEKSFTLDKLGLKYVGMGKNPKIYEQLAILFKGAPTREAQMKNLHRAPLKLAQEYALKDPEIAIRLWLWQEEQIKAQGLEEIWALEKRLTPVLVDIERDGVRVDIKKAESSIKNIDITIHAAQRALDKTAGKPINPNSPFQLREALDVKKRKDGMWMAGGWLLLEATDGGEGSLDADALRKLADHGNKIAVYALQCRKLVKARSFLTNHILGHTLQDRVYPNYNQTRGDRELGTGTGRLSIDDPALQQIPKRDVENATIVRSCFLPDEGQLWSCNDWKQFEFRWFAHYAEEPKLMEMYRKDKTMDFHQMVANLTGLPRVAQFAGNTANAKQINLGLVFGMGQGRMAAEMGLEYTTSEYDGREVLLPGAKAKQIFEDYHEAIPGVKRLLDKAASIAKSRGYVKTIMGRHIRFPGGQFTHKAGGLVFQGTSADCMKEKMIELHTMSKAKGFRYLLSVHDEHNTSIPRGNMKLQAEIKQVLETFDGVHCPIKCEVPILSSMAVGKNWWLACKE